MTTFDETNKPIMERPVRTVGDLRELLKGIHDDVEVFSDGKGPLLVEIDPKDIPSVTFMTDFDEIDDGDDDDDWDFDDDWDDDDDDWDIDDDDDDDLTDDGSSSSIGNTYY